MIPRQTPQGPLSIRPWLALLHAQPAVPSAPALDQLLADLASGNTG
jgi:hypothetical protein